MSDKVLRYTPPFLKDNELAKKIYTAEKNELERLLKCIRKIFFNFFIISCDKDGIVKWEKILQLSSNSNLSIDARILNCIQQISFRPPFTRQSFLETLEFIWGQGNYTFEINMADYSLLIDVLTDEPTVFISFQKNIRRLIPANLTLNFALAYTYFYLQRHFTYAQLNDNELYTYGQLSKYSNDY